MMIGIVVPAYNEEHDLPACIDALKQAINFVVDVEIKLLIVLDNCSDNSLKIVQDAGIDYVECDFKCVGTARDFGIRHLLGQRIDWIACTDADSQVNQDWIWQQLAHQPADVICGVVEVEDWQTLSVHTQMRYSQHYQDRMNHRHIHGANLSFSSQAYLNAGGFQKVSCHEDVKLVTRMQDLNLNIVWSNKVRIKTSSRLEARAPEGFASFLKNIEMNLLPA